MTTTPSTYPTLKKWENVEQKLQNSLDILSACAAHFDMDVKWTWIYAFFSNLVNNLRDLSSENEYHKSAEWTVYILDRASKLLSKTKWTKAALKNILTEGKRLQDEEDAIEGKESFKWPSMQCFRAMQLLRAVNNNTNVVSHDVMQSLIKDMRNRLENRPKPEQENKE